MHNMDTLSYQRAIRIIGRMDFISKKNIADNIRHKFKNHLLSIVNDILDFTKIEAGELKMNQTQ